MSDKFDEIENPTIGDNIRCMRMDLGMSQQELADRMCVSHDVVSRWESGKTDISFVDAERLCNDVFGIGVDGLPAYIEYHRPRFLENKAMVEKFNSDFENGIISIDDAFFSEGELESFERYPLLKKATMVLRYCAKCDDPFFDLFENNYGKWLYSLSGDEIRQLLLERVCFDIDGVQGNLDYFKGEVAGMEAELRKKEMLRDDIESKGWDWLCVHSNIARDWNAHYNRKFGSHVEGFLP